MLSNFAFSVPHPKKFVLSLSNGREGREAIRVCQWRGGARRINNLEAHINERNSTCYSLKHSAVISDLRCIRKPSNYHQIKCNYHAPSNHANVHDQKTDWLDELQNVAHKQWDAFYRFSRPHTVIGTIIGITTVSVLPVETISDISPAFFLGLFKALVPAIFMNIYVVGLNQLFDVDIDKVNKPTLPLASGEFSMSTGIVLVAASCIMSFAMGVKSGSPPLLFALLISFLLGSAYSVDLPLLRWKRHAFLAASCILCVRAILVQLAFFMHIQRYVLGRPTVLKKSVIFATVFMCFFSAVIALFKDIPDVDGDRDYGIQSFSVRLGQKKVFWLCIKLLLTAYAIAMLVGASSCDKLRGLVTVFGHGSLASALLLRARRLDVQNKTSITAFYMFIWKLFYAEYFLIPFVS